MASRSIVSYLAIGVIGLPIAAHLTVNAAVSISTALGVSAEIVGLTIVAFGTSLPELATGLSAAFRGRASLGIGNVIGSNIFNLSAILGITASVVPLPIGPHILNLDIWIMVVTSLSLLVLLFGERRIGRPLGAVALACYCAYIAAAFLT